MFAHWGQCVVLTREQSLYARLVEEGEAMMKEADALEAFGQRKFGANDNSSS